MIGFDIGKLIVSVNARSLTWLCHGYTTLTFTLFSHGFDRTQKTRLSYIATRPDSLANVGILVTFEQVRMLKFVDAEPA